MWPCDRLVTYPGCTIFKSMIHKCSVLCFDVIGPKFRYQNSIQKDPLMNKPKMLQSAGTTIKKQVNGLEAKHC